jgi:hypothetical protein
MGIYSILGSGAFAAACVNFTIDAIKRSHRQFNLAGCLLIDTGYCLFLYDKLPQIKLQQIKLENSEKINDLLYYLI